MKRPFVVLSACLLAAAGVALGFRLPRLDVRPMHADEAAQAYKAGHLLETGAYAYNPRDHHGPTLYYLAIPSMWLASAQTFAETTEFTYRIVPVLFGVGLILLLWPLAAGLGRPAAVCAAVLTAISPAMVFYSRYYIQETLLVFFTFGAIVSVWRYARTQRGGWLVLAGACFGLMHATKETWVLSAAAMAAALGLTALWTRRAVGKGLELRSYLRVRPLAGAAVAGVLVAVVFFSSFFTHPRGVFDSVLAYANFAHRAGGAGLHDNPWYFYLGLLAYSPIVTGIRVGPWWSEGLILGLAAIGIVAALTRKGVGGANAPLLRFLAFYAVVLTAIYAVIPYKTPWCALQFLHPLILLAGVGAAAVVRWAPAWPLKGPVCIVLAVLAAHLGWQSYRACFRFYADQRNPYVYAGTSTDVYNLIDRVEGVAAVSPQGRGMIIKVITPENYSPLPWYLRHFNEDHVGYYHEVPEDPDAAVIITSAEFQEVLEARLRGTYDKRSRFGLRPGVLMNVYVAEDLWKAYMERRTGAKSPPKGGAP